TSRESQQLQHADAPPVEVNFVPLESVTRRCRVRMMIVVPTLAKGEQGYPPTVARIFTGVEALPAPHMSGRVHQPGRVERKRHPQKDSPQQDTPTTEGEHQDRSEEHTSELQSPDHLVCRLML